MKPWDLSGNATDRVVVTGAFGYTGKYITRRLLADGKLVRTLTGHPDRPNEFGNRIEVAPLQFSDRRALVETLRGAGCLFNTYWIRFNYGRATFEEAVANTKVLFEAAKEAGINKVVHVSISNPSVDSALPYFRGKAILEAALEESGRRYAILRPTVIFGPEDILVNNIAWLLRRFPAFAIPGSGNYRLQPVFVEDVAELAVRAYQEQANSVIDAVGPEIFSFDEFVRLIARQVRSKAQIIHVAPGLGLFFSSLLGAVVRDKILTADEVEGLMAGLLVSAGPATGRTRFSDWLKNHSNALGTTYASEVARHYARG
jgi:nucleoside-diphosphate-sugar epimerase